MPPTVAAKDDALVRDPSCVTATVRRSCHSPAATMFGEPIDRPRLMASAAAISARLELATGEALRSVSVALQFWRSPRWAQPPRDDW
jgi:hypothetical protein